MADSLRSTETLIADLDRATSNVALFGSRYRVELLSVRAKLRTRLKELEGRLTTADEKFPHRKLDDMNPRHEDVYLQLLAEYEAAYDALNRKAPTP